MNWISGSCRAIFHWLFYDAWSIYLKKNSISIRLCSLEVAGKLCRKNNTLLGSSWDFCLGQKSADLQLVFAWLKPHLKTWHLCTAFEVTEQFVPTQVYGAAWTACWIFRWNHLFKDLFCSPSFAKICDLFQAQDLVDECWPHSQLVQIHHKIAAYTLASWMSPLQVILAKSGSAYLSWSDFNVLYKYIYIICEYIHRKILWPWWMWPP